MTREAEERHKLRKYHVEQVSILEKQIEFWKNSKSAPPEMKDELVAALTQQLESAHRLLRGGGPLDLK